MQAVTKYNRERVLREQRERDGNKENKGLVLPLTRSRDPKCRHLVRNGLKVTAEKCSLPGRKVSKTPSRPPLHDLARKALRPLPVQKLVGHDVKSRVRSEGQDDTDFGAYPLTSHPRGPAIIINNEHFDKMPSRRWGTECDGEALQTLFNHLGFETTTYDNLTAGKMKAVLKDFAKRDHTHTQCLVVAILSHGTEGGLLCGTDGVLVGIKELADLFTGRKCSTLVGKPKLFFIQACRGNAEDNPAIACEVTDGDDTMTVFESSKKKRELLPEQADFLLSFSTPEGYTAWRHPERGSWYVQSLVEVFMEFAGKEHLLDMLTEVGRRVAEYQTRSGFKQIPALVSQLRKKLYFNPGQKKAVNSLHKLQLGCCVL